MPVVLIAFLAVLQSDADAGQVPADWFINPPREDGVLVAVATDSAAHPTLAYLSAVARARSDLAGQVHTQVQSHLEQFSDQADAANTPETALFNTAVDEILNYAQIQQVQSTAGGRVFVLATLSIDPDARPAEPAGYGLARATQTEAGIPLDPIALAAWSARLDLSLAFWCRIQSLSKHFEEQTERGASSQYELAISIEGRMLPAHFVHYDYIRPVAGGAFQARARIRPELEDILTPALVAKLPLKSLAKFHEELQDTPEGTSYSLVLKFVDEEYALTQDWEDNARTWDFAHRPLSPKARTALEPWLHNPAWADLLE